MAQPAGVARSTSALAPAPVTPPAQRPGAPRRGHALLDGAGRVVGRGGDWAELSLLLPPSRVEGLSRLLAGALAEVEVELDAPDGAPGAGSHPRRIRGRALALPPGAGAVALLELEDISEQRCAAFALQVYRTVVQRSKDAIGVIDTEGRYLEQNPAHERLIGYAAEELAGRTPAIHLGDEVFGQVARALSTTGHFEGLVRSTPRSGEPLELELSAFAVVDERGRPVCYVGVKRDAVAHRAQRALRESEDRFQRVAATVPGVVYQFEIRPDGTRGFPFVSEGVRALFGLEVEEVVGDAGRAFSMVHPDDLPGLLADLQRAAAGRTPWRHEMRMALPGGTRWIHAAAAAPDLTAEGALLWSGFVIDVTDRRTVEDQLKQAKELAEAATRAKSLLLANTSHELRTPLNAVVGMADLLLAGRLEPAQRQSAEVIRASAAHLQALIDDLLDVSTIEAGRLELERRPFDLRRCVRSALDQVATRAAEKGLPVATKVADGVPEEVQGDERRLRQVLVNLLGNAVKFTDAGEVRLEVEPAELSTCLPSGHMAAGPAVRLSVHDTGIGIPQERLDLLFRPFSQVDPSATRRHGGTGLGLAICQRLVGLMGGRIEVETALQRGSTFRVLLPLEATSPVRRPACAARPLTVLVVEDNAVNRAVALRLLASLGHVAEVATTGAEALLALERRAFDVVLMDVQMPGMDGHEATRRIAARFPRERRPWVVAMTASAFPGDRERCLEAGMDDYVSKPVGLAELERALSRSVAGQGGRPPAAPAEPPPREEQVVDGTNLAVLQAGADGDAAVAELIDLFLEDLGPSVEAIRAAVTARAASRLVGAAHALKGSCGSLGANALARVVALLEAAGRSADLDGAGKLLPDLERELARARAALLAMRPGR